MEEPEAPRRVKKVVVRRVRTDAASEPTSPPARRPVATIPQVRRPARRPRETPADEPTVPRRTLRDRTANAGRKTAAGVRLVSELTVAELKHVHWPQWPETVAAAVVGAGAGLLMASLGAMATLGVSAVRGVAGGAGGVGLVIVAALAVIVVVAAAFCLRRLGSPRGWTVASLGAVVVTVLVLALFLRPAATAWAFLILPALGALAFVAADRALALAERSGVEE